LRLIQQFLFCALVLTLSVNTVLAQTCRGKVVDAKTGRPLIGAHVLEAANSQNLVITDHVGAFSINVKSKALLVVHVGYEDSVIYLLDGHNELLVGLRGTDDLLDQIVVTGNKSESALKEMTISVERINPRIITDKNPSSVSSIIHQIPGVNMVDGQVSIRGGSGWSYGAGSRVIVLVDGVPLMSGDAGQALWSFITVDNIEEIEVVKGASSVLYGSAALNGIISIRTKWTKAKPYTSVTTFGGGFTAPREESWEWSENPLLRSGARVLHSRRMGKNELVFNGEWIDDDGYRKGDPDRRIQGGVNWRRRIGEQGRIGIRSKVLLNKSGSFLLWRNLDSAYLPLEGSNTENANLRIAIDPFFSLASKNGWRHQINTRYLLVDNNVDNGDSSVDQSNRSDWYFAEYLLQKRWNPNSKDWLNAQWSVGVTGNYTVTRSPLFSGDQTAGNMAAFTQIRNNFGPFSAEFGFRFEEYRLNDRISRKPIIRGGLNVPLTKSTFLRLSYGEGFRFPTIAETYISTTVGPVSVYPNVELNPEIGSNIEIGLTQGFQIKKQWRGMLNAAVFQMKYDDMVEFTFGQWSSVITPENNFGIGFKSINTGPAKISGFEISGTAVYKHDQHQINIQAGYVLSNPVSEQPDLIWGKDSVGKDLSYRTTSSDTISNYLKYRSRHTAKLDVMWKYKKWEAGISGRFNSKVENVDLAFITPPISFFVPGVQESRNLYPYGLNFDVRVFYLINRTFRVGLVSNNVFNRERFIRPADMGGPRLLLLQLRYTTPQ